MFLAPSSDVYKRQVISHVSIMAKSMEVPTLVEVEIQKEWDGHMAIVDGYTGRELMTLIRSLAEDDKRTILISSHQLYQIQQICDRVGLFVDGRLIACGRIDELAGQMRREGHYALEAAAFPDDSGFEELLRSLGNVEQVERTGDFYVVHSRSDLCRELNRRALEKGYTLRHLRQRGNDLDEIYRRYFEKGEQKNGGLNQKKKKGFLSFGREQR